MKMKQKLFLVVLFLTVSIFLSGCTAPILIDLTGNWTITGTTTSGTSQMFTIGEVRTDTCSILDDNGVLSITNFTSLPGNVDMGEVNWEDCTGTFTNPAFTIGPLNGNVMYYGDPTSFIINFEGNMNEDGTSGTGIWTATVKINGVTVGTGGGTSVFTKN